MIKFIFQIIIECALLCILFFNVFVLKKADCLVGLLSISGFLILLLTTVKYKKPIKQRCKDVNFIIIGLSIILLGIMYLTGLFTGFISTYSPFSSTSISTKKWILIIAIVIVEELVRYTVSLTETKRNNKYILSEIIMFLNFIIIDVMIAPKIYSLSNYHQICEFFCLFLVQSISKNLFLNFISKKYGYEPCLWYRLLIDLYIFIIPIKPEINSFILAVALLIFPYLMYRVITELTEKRKIENRIPSKIDKALNTVELVIVAIVVMLVSCEFKYGMVAVASESMTGAINKGDAIIYEKYNKKDDIEKGQVIVFKHNDTRIVHRVVKSLKVSEGEIYKTKGDANKEEDKWIVKKEDIIGKVNMRVLWIAWPTVLLNEIFY